MILLVNVFVIAERERNGQLDTTVRLSACERVYAMFMVLQWKIFLKTDI